MATATLTQTVEETVSVERGTIMEERWVVCRFFPETLDDVIKHLSALRAVGSTGQMTINLQCGGIGQVEYRARGARIQTTFSALLRKNRIENNKSALDK